MKDWSRIGFWLCAENQNKKQKETTLLSRRLLWQKRKEKWRSYAESNRDLLNLNVGLLNEFSIKIRRLNHWTIEPFGVRLLKSWKKRLYTVWQFIRSAKALAWLKSIPSSQAQKKRKVYLQKNLHGHGAAVKAWLPPPDDSFHLACPPPVLALWAFRGQVCFQRNGEVALEHFDAKQRA